MSLQTATDPKTSQGGDTAPLLSVNNIEVIYDHVILVLKGVSLDVPAGGVVRCWAPTGPASRPR